MELPCPSCIRPTVRGAKFCPHCGERLLADGLEELGDPLVGQTLAGYRIHELIAEGGMGSVYEAEQVALARRVCLKTILPSLLTDETVRQRMSREARIMSSLRHPNIVSLLDFGTADDGRLYIVLELIDGVSLAQLIAQEAPMSIKRATALMTQILSALEEAHHHGVLHRDLKPDNVLVERLRDGTEHVQVLDFGLAKRVDSDVESEVLTMTGTVCGTPGYMAPEQIQGMALDGRVDLYPAGIILYELLTGERPFPMGNPHEVMHNQLRNPVPSPSSVSPLVDAVVERATQRRPENRFRDAGELRSALESAVRISTRQLERGHADRPSGETPTAVATLRCPSCGHNERSTQKFCGECGAALRPAIQPPVANTAPTVDALPAVPQRIVPEQLLGELQALKSLVTESRVEEMALVARLHDVDGASEGEVAARRAQCDAALRGIVMQHGGQLLSESGERLQAVFALSGGAARETAALKCAQAIVGFMRAANQRMSHAFGVSVGVDGGDGSGRGRDALLGVADSIAEVGLAGSVMVTRGVMLRGERVVTFGAAQPLRLAETGADIEVFPVEAVNATLSGATALPGRETALTEARGLLARVEETRQPAGLIYVGERGIGKTAVLEAIVPLARVRGWHVAKAAGLGRGRGREHDGLRQLLSSLCAGPLAGAAADAPPLCEALPLLASRYGCGQEAQRLLALLGEGAQVGGFDPADAKLLDRAALMRLLVQMSSDGGVLFLLDDAGALDAASATLLESVLESAAGAPIALIAAALPEKGDRLGGALQRVVLGPLEQAEIDAIIRRQLEGAQLPESLRSAIAERANGNPLFVSELLRALIDSGCIVRERGEWTVAATEEGISLADSLAMLLRARMEDLAPYTRAALRYAAVAGRSFASALVAQVVPDKVDLDAAMAECVAREVLEADPTHEGCFRFVQALMHEAVLRSFAARELEQAHLRLAEAIASGAPTAGEEPAGAAARHFLAAGRHRTAANWLVSAGRRLLERDAHAEASEYFDQALEIMLGQDAGNWLGSERAVTTLLGVATDSVRCLVETDVRRALKLADQIIGRTPPRWGRVARALLLKHRGEALMRLGRPGEATDCLRTALDALDAQREPAHRVGVQSILAAALEASGDLNGAVEELLDGLNHVTEGVSGDPEQLWRYLNQLGRVYLKLGRADKAQDFFFSAQEQAKQVGSLVGESRALMNSAGVQAAAGNIGAAREALQRSLGLASEAGDRIGVARIRFNLGRLHLAQRELEAASEQLEASRELAEALGWREGRALAVQALDALRAQQNIFRPAGTGAR